MVKSKLVGRYELVTLEYVNNTSQDKRVFIVQGPQDEMCSFYEALKDAMETAVNADSKKFGYTDMNEVHHYEYTDEELDNWRTEPNEIAAYEKAKAQGKRENLMRFVAYESRFVPDDSPRSWVKALEAAILVTGIQVERESVEV